jgi:protein gp37
MADHSSIEWTDATWNPITGCSVVSPGCTNCYAMKLAGTRLKHIDSRKGLTRDTKAGPVWTGEVRLNKQWLYQPFDWKKPRRIFVCAHGDLFAENVPDDWILDVFTVMAAASHHTYQVLTKRPERACDFLSKRWRLDDIYGNWYTFSGKPAEVYSWPLHNVWIGASAEDQTRYNSRRRWLDETPASKRFWSLEPLLGPITMNIQHTKPDWVIVGGESGRDARPMHPEWARSIRDQCAAAGVPFFFKQWGEWWPQECNRLEHQRFAERLKIAGITPSRERPERGCWGADDKWHPGCIAGAPPAYTSWKIGKKAAGRMLDGVEHNEFPKVTT